MLPIMFTGSATSRRSWLPAVLPGAGACCLSLLGQATTNPSPCQGEAIPGQKALASLPSLTTGLKQQPGHCLWGVFNPCHRAQSRAKGHFAEGICSHRGDTFYLLMYLRVRFLECRNSGGSSLQLPAWHGEYEHPKSLLSPAQVLEFWLSPSFGSPTL